MFKKRKIFKRIKKLNFQEYWEYEKKFGSNHYHGNKNLEAFSILPGELPILLCVPHTVKTEKLVNSRDIRIDSDRNEQKKRNYKLNDVIKKKQEKATGFMAYYLNELTGVHALVRNNYSDVTHTTKFDNYYLREYLREHSEIKMVIDLHGYIETDKFDITCGTNNGLYLNSKSNYYKIKRIMRDCFKKSGLLHVNFDFDLQAKSKLCVARQVHKEFGIMTIQMEVNKKYRRAKTDIKNIQLFLKGMSDFILEMNKFLKGD